MKQALVSVIVPVYNQEKYLRQTLDSICGQTYRNLEIIMVDDGSTDSSPAILAEYAAKDSRIIVLTQKNQYAGVARNYGMQKAQGEYYSLLDSDDIFEPDMIEQMVARAQETQADIVVCRADTFDEENGRRPMPWQMKDKYLEGVERRRFVPSESVPWCIFQFLIGWSWDKLYRADFVKKHGLQFAATRHSNDGPFVFPSLVAAQVVSIVDEKPLVHYRVSSTQLSSTGSMTKAPTSCLDSIETIYAKIEGLKASAGVMDAFYCWVAQYIHWNINQLFGEARWALIRAVRDRIEPRFRIVEHLRRIRTQEQNAPLCRDAEPCFVTYESMVAPTISVSIPTYNAAEFLHEALDSLIVQDVRCMEIICVNDGSRDNSLSILQEYERKDTRLRIIDVPNGGYGKAMNLGLDAAVGKYFAIFEPDDYLPKGAYRTLLDMAEGHSLDISKGCIAQFYEKNGQRVVEADGNVEAGRVICPREYLQSFKFNMCTVTCLYNMAFLRRHRIRYNETPGASYQDNGMHMLSFAYAERLMCTKDVVYMYRVDNVNSSIHQFAAKPYAMRDEFTYIRERLLETPEVWEQVKSAWLFKRFSAHMNTFPKICNGIKMEYLHDLRRELLPYERYDTSLFWYGMKREFFELMISPEYMLGQQMLRGLALPGAAPKAIKPEKSSCWYGLPLWMVRRSHGRVRHLLFGFIPLWEEREKNGIVKCKFLGIPIGRKRK